MTRTDTAGNIYLLADDILPYLVDSLDVGAVTRNGSHISHTGIHVTSTYGMSHCLFLLQYRLVRLQIDVLACRSAARVEEELGLVEIFLISCHGIEAYQCHFGNLMSGNHTLLSGAFTDILAYAVGITDSYIQEVPLACSLIISHSPFHHVTQIIELVAQILHLRPAFRPRPIVRMLGVHGTCGVKIPVRFLGGGHYDQYAVDIFFQFLVRVSLQGVTCTFNRLIDIRIVKGEASHLILITGMSSFHKVFITSRFLTLTESQRDGYLAACLQALSPETVRHLH